MKYGEKSSNIFNQKKTISQFFVVAVETLFLCMV